MTKSLDLLKISTSKTNQEAIDGKTTGLIFLNEFVTWRTKHFGFTQNLTSIISDYERPFLFVDEQIKGIFKSFYRKHLFEQIGEKVIMKDIFIFTTTFGILGQIFNQIVLINYMQKFLIERNKIIKEFDEINKWKLVLKDSPCFPY